MKTVFFILSALTLMAFGCNKNSGVDSGTEMQKEETFNRDGNKETYELEETRESPDGEMQREEVVPGDSDHMQKQDENHNDHIKQQEEEDARRSADESADLIQE